MSTKANSKQSTLALAGANVAGKAAASSKDEKKQGTKNKAENSEADNPPAEKKLKTSHEDSKEVKKDATPIMAPPPPTQNGAGAPPAAPGAPAPMDTTADSPSKRNHEKLMADTKFPSYHSKVLDTTEWLALKPSVGRKQDEDKLSWYWKQSDAEKKMGRNPRLAESTTPFSQLSAPQGNPFGDWKNPNPEVQKNQNKVVPTKAKFKVGIRTLPWDPTNVNANGEDPYCAEYVDHVYPTIERRGFEAGVRLGVIPESDTGMFAKQWKADVDAGRTTKTREAYIVDSMIEFKKILPGVSMPLFDEQNKLTQDAKKGKPRPALRSVIAKKPVVHPLYDDDKNFSSADVAQKQQAPLPVVTDKFVQETLEKLKKERSDDGKPMVYDPLNVLTHDGKHFPFSKAKLNSGDVANITMRFALTKDPTKGHWMIQKRLKRVAKLKNGVSTNADAAAAAALAEVGLVGGDDFDLSEDVVSPDDTQMPPGGDGDGDDVGAATFGLATNNGPTGMDTSDSPH